MELIPTHFENIVLRVIQTIFYQMILILSACLRRLPDFQYGNGIKKKWPGWKKFGIFDNIHKKGEYRKSIKTDGGKTRRTKTDPNRFKQRQ